MSDSKVQPEPISSIWSIEKPEGRFNDWGERKWITATDKKRDQVDKEISAIGLNDRARDLFLAAKLTEARGIEFAVFSNTQIPAPLGIDKGGRIVPCFRPFNPNKPKSKERQAAMARRGIYVYNGWLPLDKLSKENLEEAVTLLDEIVSIFSVVGNFFAYWEPKYKYTRPPIPSYFFHEPDLQAIAISLGILEQLSLEDREAIRRSIAWMSSALRNEPVQRFLHLFVSIESLATYIESSKTSTTSILKRTFAGNKISKSQQRSEREKCVEEIRESAKSELDYINRAFSECLQTSIRKTLQTHLLRIFKDDKVNELLFEDKTHGKTLWLLRNDIAHGNLHLLSEEETQFITSRVGTLEDIARNYLRSIFSSLVRSPYFPPTRRPMLTLPAFHAQGSISSEFKGPIDMAEYYLNVEAMSSAYVKVTFI